MTPAFRRAAGLAFFVEVVKSLHHLPRIRWLLTQFGVAMATNVEMVQGESKLLSYDVVDEDGTAVNVTGAECTWELSRYQGEVAILTKTTADDITVSGTTIEVELAATDTEDLDGLYYHELTIVDTASNTSKTHGTLLVSAEIQAEPVTP